MRLVHTLATQFRDRVRQHQPVNTMKKHIVIAAILIAIINTATAVTNTDAAKELRHQAVLAQEHNSLDDKAAFIAAADILEGKDCKLTSEQHKRLSACRASAEKAGAVSIVEAIDLVFTKSPVLLTSSARVATGTPCNRILRNGKVCGESEKEHVVIAGHIFCPHDTCLKCGKEVGMHSSDGRCPNTVSHNEVGLAPSTSTQAITLVKEVRVELKPVQKTPVPAPKVDESHLATPPSGFRASIGAGAKVEVKGN